MKIKLYEKTETEKEYDISFPIYRKHSIDLYDCSTNIIYFKITELDGVLKLVQIEICYDDSIEIKIVNNYKFDKSDIDYNLGLNEYRSNETEFNEALAMLKNTLEDATR